MPDDMSPLPDFRISATAWGFIIAGLLLLLLWGAGAFSGPTRYRGDHFLTSARMAFRSTAIAFVEALESGDQEEVMTRWNGSTDADVVAWLDAVDFTACAGVEWRNAIHNSTYYAWEMELRYESACAIDADGNLRRVIFVAGTQYFITQLRFGN
jgi:hypothetical protein